MLTFDSKKITKVKKKGFPRYFVVLSQLSYFYTLFRVMKNMLTAVSSKIFAFKPKVKTVAEKLSFVLRI